MVVCVCKNVTEGQIQKAICAGVCCMRDLSKQLGVAAQCGQCGVQARELLERSQIQPSEKSKEQ